MTTSADSSPLDPQPDLAWLVSLARRLAHPGEDADDLAQETWLVALQHADRSKGSSRSWLAGVLRNLRRMRARTDRRRVARERDALPDAPASPEAAMEQLETLEALRVALGELDPVDRRLVLGRYATGQTAVQLGEQFELPASTVRTRLARAKERLRDDVQSVRGVACFAPWALRPTDVSIGTAGGVVMGTATKIGVGIAAVAVLAVGAHRLAAAPASTPATPVVAAVPAASAAPSTRQTSEGIAARSEARRIKRERIRERREQRTSASVAASPADEPTAIVTDQCDDGCIGTLSLQLALARELSGCRDELAAGAQGKTKFRAHVIAEPGIGAVVDAVELVENTTGDADFAECIMQSAPLAELADPEQPISDTFVFRYSVGVPTHPASEFLAAHPELLAAHPELAGFAAREPGAPASDEESTAFARWIDQDAQAQAAFGNWAAEEGLDLAKVRVD